MQGGGVQPLKHVPAQHFLHEQAEDRESAYEILLKKAEQRSAATEQEKADKAAEKEAKAQQPHGSTRESATDRFVKNMASTAGRQIGSMLIRGILGGLKWK